MGKILKLSCSKLFTTVGAFTVESILCLVRVFSVFEGTWGPSGRSHEEGVVWTASLVDRRKTGYLSKTGPDEKVLVLDLQVERLRL